MYAPKVNMLKALAYSHRLSIAHYSILLTVGTILSMEFLSTSKTLEKKTAIAVAIYRMLEVSIA